jgi:hypothetical protein
MLNGYAVHDHHENVDQAKKACIRIPARPLSFAGWMVIHIHRLPDSHQGRSAFAEGMQMPSFLF